MIYTCVCARTHDMCAHLCLHICALGYRRMLSRTAVETVMGVLNQVVQLEEGGRGL